MATKTGTFMPEQAASTLYAMAGDDCSLHFDLNDLTPKQQADHNSNVFLTAMLQVALLALGKPGDRVALFDAFEAPEWRAVLARYQRWFERMRLEPVKPAGRSFHPAVTFYSHLADRLPDVDLVNLYMVSGSNAVLHQNPQLLEVSRALNSKFHFAQHAPVHGIPVPDTLVTEKGQLDSPTVRAFFDRYPGGVMLKLLGLAGARNVTAVGSIVDAQAVVAEYDNEMPVLLQEQLDLSEYTEMTVDLCVTDDDVTITNVRQILFADGLWVGNLLGDRVSLSPGQQKGLRSIGAYARHFGYAAPEGCNCGVDFFVRGEELIVTEINARWTGGLFPAEILRHLGARNRDAVAFFDVAPVEALGTYLDFIEGHLWAAEAPWSMIPLGISPFPVPIDGTDHVYVWQMAYGEFNAFAEAKQSVLGSAIMPTADAIRLP